MTITNLPGNLPVADITSDITFDELCAARAVLLETRKESRPAAAVVRLTDALDEAGRMAVYELLQYVDLCVIDRASVERLGITAETALPNAASVLTDMLVKRFALGGVVISRENYARLNTPVAERIYPAVSAWVENLHL